MTTATMGNCIGPICSESAAGVQDFNIIARLGPSLLAAALLAPALLAPRPASAIVTLRVQQVGNDVVITGSGTANTTALTLAGTGNDYTNILTDAQIYAGPAAFDNGSVSLWSNISSGPLAFGSDPLVSENSSSGTGALFGILANTQSRPLISPARAITASPWARLISAI